MPPYSHGSHPTHRLKYHLVWIPQSIAKRVLRGSLARRLYELLKQCSEINDWPIDELNVQGDHVHLLIQLPPSTSVSQAVKIMQGGTSHQIRQAFPELEEFLWDGSLWATGFFAESEGQVTEGRIKLYSKNQ